MKAKIINASAGTGKTYTIAIEYLKALNKGIKYEQIQVITFTKKATAEIRERVFKFLSDIVFEKNGYEDIVKSMGDKINKDLLEEVYIDMLKNSENIKISTNDAFIRKIFKLAIAPYKNVYNIDMISDNNDEVTQYVLDKLIEKNYDDFERLYLHIEKKKIDDLKNYLNNQIIKIRNIIYKLLDKKNSEIYTKKYDFNKIKSELLQAIYPYKDIEFFVKNKYSVQKDLIDKIEAAKNIEQIAKLDEKFKPIKSRIHYLKDSPNKNEAEEINAIIGNLKEKICECYLEDEIFEYNKIYRRIAKKVYEYLEEYNFSNRKFTFSDISYYTYKYFSEKELELVKDGYATDKFYEIIGSKIKVFMVDEFQDTDDLQLQIFMPLFRNCDEILIVGDYKQAIYAFRGADSSIFRNIKDILEKNIENIDIEIKSLNTCYRTRKNIIDYVNENFKRIENYSYEQVDCKKDYGYVKIQQVDKDSQYDAIYENIKDKKNSNSAILFIKNDEIDKMGKKLYENGIDYNSMQTMELTNDKTIRAIKLLIDYLVTKDTYKLLEFLRSEYIKLSLNDTLKFVKNELEENDIIKNIRELEKDSSDFKRKFISYFGYRKNMTDDQVLNMNMYLDYVDKANNLTDFYNKCDRLLSGVKKINSKNESAINILTIHKSKGLEYDDIHYFMDMKKNYLREYSLAYKREDNKIVDFMFIKKKAFIENTEIGSEYLKYFDDNMLEENINLIYVALTRPRNNLYIYFKKDTNILNLDNNSKGKEYIPSENKETTNQSEIKLNNLDFFEKTKYEQNTNLNSPTNIQKELIRKKGLALHYYMEHIIDENDLEYAKSMLYKRYANLIGITETKHIIKKANEYIKNNKDMYDTKKYEIHNEFDISSDNETKVYRIDRLNIDHKNKKIVIYDYKTEKNADKDTKYIEQIENYKKVLSQNKDYENYEIITKLVSIEIN